MKWEDFDEATKEYGGKSEFYQMEEGSNKCRVVSAPEVLAQHWKSNKPIICVGLNQGCLECQKGIGAPDKLWKPVVRFLMNVIDRKDDQVKMAQFGWTIANFLRDFKKNPQYAWEGDIMPYDITINKTRTGTRPTDIEYSVIADRNNIELTENEKVRIHEAKTPAQVIAALKGKKDEVEIDDIPL